MKQYIIARQTNGKISVEMQAEILDKDHRGRSVGSHIETTVPDGPFDIGVSSNDSKALALTIMKHYMGPGGDSEAAHKSQFFHDAFLIHHKMNPGSRLQISSDAIDRLFSLSIV